MTSTPRSPSDFLTSGSSSAAASARLSVAITSFGVCAGATKPCQVVASKFLIPSSSMVGISGKTVVRLRVATASGRTFPSRIWGTTDEAVANIIYTCRRSHPATPAPRPCRAPDDVDLGLGLEQLAGEMRGQAVAGRGKIELARIGLGER